MAAMVFVFAVSAGACDDSIDPPVAALEPEAFTPLEVANILLALDENEVAQAQLASANATEDLATQSGAAFDLAYMAARISTLCSTMTRARCRCRIYCDARRP